MINKSKIQLLLIAIGFCWTSAAQQNTANGLQVSIDVESAKAICQLLSQKKADTTQIRQAAGLYGNQLLIKKVKGYSGAGEDVFVSTLREIIETGRIEKNDPYNWQLVREKLPEIVRLTDYISTHKQAFIDSVKKIIQPFVAANFTADARACFLAGGGSLGFTIGDDPAFNVALQKIGDDLKGLQYLVAHELYHTIQEVGQRKREHERNEKGFTYSEKASYLLLYNLWAEGTANLVGDMAKIKDPGAFAKEQQQQYRKNRERRYQNFQLFEAMLFRQYYDSTADYQSTYDIGYSTAFDETSYFVGYEMGKKLVAHRGTEAIAQLLTRDPLRFMVEYIELYKKLPDDKSFVRFSPSIEEIVQKLMPLEDRL